MTRTKIGLLGLCAMLFSMMAFGTAAQAEPNASWLLAKNEINTPLVPYLPASIGLKKDPGVVLVLHSEILKIKVLFLCTEVKAVNAKLLPEGSIGEKTGTVKNSKVLFSGCTTDLNGATASECTPTDPVDGAGTIVTKNGHALLVLHELKIIKEGKEEIVKDKVIKILPDEGETFATIALPMGCPIGTSVPVIGKAALKDCKPGDEEKHLLEHLVEPFPALTELWTISKTEEHKATLLGSSLAYLTGEHEGLLFSGMWQ